MSAAAAATTAADAPPPPPKTGKKKLLIIVAAAVLALAVVGGGATFYVMKKKAAAAAAAAEGEEGEGGEAAGSAADHQKPDAHARDTSKPPTFMPLEPFVVNLADREVDRFAQVGITLELEDPKAADQLKAYMPAIRNGILMILAHKTSQELLERAGKERLAGEIARASVRPMGIEVDEPEAEAKPGEAAPKKKRKKALDAPPSPVRAVHFSSFIIQ